MRAAIGNHMRWCGVLGRITKPPCRTFVKDGWEFSARNCAASDRLKASRLRFPRYSIYDSEFCIKHLNSGIKFSFNAYDALVKSDQERQFGDPLKSSMPSYASSFLPLIDRQCDSAYVGTIFIQEPGEQPKNINPIWELIDWKTLHEQFRWMTENEQISTVPIKYTHCDGHEPTFFVTDKKEGKISNGLLNPLLNLQIPLYVDFDTEEDEKSSCNFSLVVTDCGWFVRLYQLFSSYFGDTRERMMTMHCSFKQNIVYREIVELQSEDFETRVPLLKHSDWLMECCPMSYVHFHEAKQLKIQEAAFMGGCDSCPVHDAARYSSFTVREWKEASLRACDISDHKIESLLSNCGERLKTFEENAGVRIQIVPLFRHPYNPVAFLMDRSVGTVKNAYVQYGPTYRNLFNNTLNYLLSWYVDSILHCFCTLFVFNVFVSLVFS